ncbi:hypothetical protein, partial [Klebsiella electrica]
GGGLRLTRATTPCSPGKRCATREHPGSQLTPDPDDHTPRSPGKRSATGEHPGSRLAPDPDDHTL